MSLIADGLLIATSLTTALYCLILSRRLRKLSDTGEGVGQQVLRLNAALTETKAAVGEIRSSAGAASDQLQQDVEVAKRQSQQLQLQIARALKSGVGVRAAPGRSAPGPDGERAPAAAGARAGRDDAAARDWAVSLEPVVEFDAVDPSEEDLDEQLRLTDAGSPDDPAAGRDAPPEEDDEFVGTGDLSEAEDHWPFDPAEGDNEGNSEWDNEGDEDLSGMDEIPGDPAELTRPRAGSSGRAGHSGQPEDGESGLLRVERMAV